MNLYLISQEDRFGRYTYNELVVCAATEDEARLIHPAEYSQPDPWSNGGNHTWASSPDKVAVEFIGVAESSIRKGIICASYNGG